MRGLSGMETIESRYTLFVDYSMLLMFMLVNTLDRLGIWWYETCLTSSKFVICPVYNIQRARAKIVLSTVIGILCCFPMMLDA